MNGRAIAALIVCVIMSVLAKAGDLSVDNLTVSENAEFQGTASITTPGGNVGMGTFTNRVGEEGTNTYSSVYLPRDGSSPMTGNLNMGGNSMSSASSVATANLQIMGGSPTNGAIGKFHRTPIQNVTN